MSPLTSDVVKAGNTAVITGASSGIGRATAVAFAAKGMHVWMLDIDKEELEAAKEVVLSKRASDSQVRTQCVFRDLLWRFLSLTKCCDRKWKLEWLTWQMRKLWWQCRKRSSAMVENVIF